MKIFLRIAVLLLLAAGFLWAAYESGRNWFLYATIFGGTVGHARLDSNLGAVSHLDTQWYWAMIVFAVLALACLAVAALLVLHWVRGDSGDADASSDTE